ncbi:WD40/YVTN/BNR-like repeat-containing protein [Streptomyces canus]|uniref:WD40/YVTN/BNR-like repeat-containing protein n=1 Tax=Streptomyces TaxID=1883 RepID=UPI0036E6E1B5
MTPTAGSSRSTKQGGATAAAKRRAAAKERAEAERRAERRKRQVAWSGAALAVLVVAGGGIYLAARDGGSSGTAGSGSAPVVGGDLHTVTVIGNRLFVGGHAAVAVSRDGGKQWKDVSSLQGADAMGWAQTPDAVLVGGHPGLFRSTDGGVTFTKVTGAGAVADAHALGGTGKTLYVGSPESGLLASTDGGRSWKVRNAQAGRSMMGSILADPTDPAKLIASDMSKGLVSSSDGGRTWKSLGGPMGAMAAAWNPKDTRQIIAVGMSSAELSTDGGATWKQAALPQGASAVAYAPDGKTLYAGVLDGQSARVYRSTDGATTWKATA